MTTDLFGGYCTSKSRACELANRDGNCLVSVCTKTLSESDSKISISKIIAERDAAICDLKLISHCFTCSNQRLDENGICVNSGGGGAPFSSCPGYVWDHGRR